LIPLSSYRGRRGKRDGGNGEKSREEREVTVVFAGATGGVGVFACRQNRMEGVEENEKV
jgi:NADPH:quinone reductase-like Zn-dependent oxidoreductase